MEGGVHQDVESGNMGGTTIHNPSYMSSRKWQLDRK